MNENIIKKIGSLPPLPKTIEEFERAYEDPDISLEEIGEILSKDPMIVANLLKRVNSPFYALREEITQVTHAVSLLGLSEVKAVVVENSIKRLLNIDMEPYGISAERFAAITHLQNHLMYRWYRKVDSRKLRVLNLASLLQEMGKILIANEAIKEDLVFQFRSEIENGTEIAQVERSFFDTTAAEVTAEMFRYWGFDKQLVEAIAYSDDFEKAPKEIKEYSKALYVVKTAAAINSPLSLPSMNRALGVLFDATEAKFLREAAESLKDYL